MKYILTERHWLKHITHKIDMVSAIPDPADEDAAEFSRNSNIHDPASRPHRQKAIQHAKDLIKQGVDPRDAVISAVKTHKVFPDVIHMGLKGER